MKQKNNFTDLNGQSESTLNVGIYSVWDTQLKQYDAPFSCSVQHLDDYLRVMINDVNSRYYGKEHLFELVQLGWFNHDTGVISLCQTVNVNNLSNYVKQSERNLQTIIKTLNFLPTGYFKMPAEMKTDIQRQIDEAITDFIENYVIPDLDVNSSSKIYIDKLEKEIERLKSDSSSFSNS